MAFTTLKVYLKEALIFRSKKGSSPSIRDIIKFFLPWRNTIISSKQPLDLCLPWLNYPVIAFIQKILTPNMHIFEYGSGGSTLFFLKHASHLVTIEHDNSWLQQISTKLKRDEVQKWEKYYKQPENDFDNEMKDPSDPKSYVSNKIEFRGMNFKQYVQIIENYPDKFFDIILIDGRARPSCLIHSLSKIKKEGYIIFDNSDTKHYFNCLISIPNNWKRLDFIGPTPCSYCFSQTTIWKVS